MSTLTRFPPEPNGYLHIGHLKAMLKDFKYNETTECILRLDDTNPESEKQEFVDAIIRDVDWLGFKYSKITYTSDYFQKLHDCAVELIKRDLAYVDSLSPAEISDLRATGNPSPHRSRTTEINLKLFDEMTRGMHPEGSLTLRLKIDPAHPNSSMRDPIAYRIKLTPHYRTGSAWYVYPSYDYSHGIVDSLEGITHSFCTREFYIRREQYYWPLEQLSLRKPLVEEFNRLNIEGVMLSKRKILAAIDAGEINGFDDPSLFTIAGLRNKGYTPDSLVYFCNNFVDYTLDDGGITPLHKFEWAVREHMSKNSLRRFAVRNPVKVNILNFDPTYICLRPEVKEGNNEVGSPRKIPLSGTIYIDSADFKVDPEKGYLRLAPGKEVRLRHYGIVKYVSHNNDNGSVTVELLSTNKTKGAAIQWVSEPDALWISDITGTNMCVENNVTAGEVYQFERVGYYRIIDNKTVSIVSELKNKYDAK